MALFIILDLAHWAAWEYLPLILKQKYFLPEGGDSFVVCKSTDALVSVAFNGVN